MQNVWNYISGAEFGVFILNAILLFAESNNPLKKKKAHIAAGYLMLYAAIYRVCLIGARSMLPAVYMEHFTHIQTQMALLMVPLSLFVMMELTKLTEVTYSTIIRHLAPPLILFSSCLFMIPRNTDVADWILCIYLFYIVTYTCFFSMQLRKAYLHYKTELENTYASDEGRSLNWFPILLGIFLGMEVIYIFLNVILATEYSNMFYSCVRMVAWSFLCYYIRQMKRADKIHVLSSNEYELFSSHSDSTAKQHSEKAISETDIQSIMAQLYSLFENKTLLTMESLNREDVARRIKTTNTALTKAIKSSTGMTFAAFIGDLRLQYAADLLFSSDDTIESIIIQSGHTSKPSFYRGFTLKFGCTPSEYRRGRHA